MTKNKILTILAAVAVLLVVVLAAGLIAQSVKAKNTDVSDTDNSVVANVDECILQNSIAFCGEQTSAYSAVALAATDAANDNEEVVVNGNSTTITLKLTSTVLSEVMLEKVNVKVNWSVEFVNPDSVWANGKSVTDYVTVTPQSDFTRTVTIKNLAPFGEQIKLTATLASDNDKTATSLIDYVKRLPTGLNTVYFPSDFGDTVNVGGSVYTSETVGTVTGELNPYGTYIELDSGFVSLLKSYLKFDIQTSDYSVPNTNVSTYINYHQTYKYYAIEATPLDSQNREIVFDYSHLISNWNSLTDAQKTAVKYAWWKAYKEYGNNITVDLVFEYYYGSKLLGTISAYQHSYISGECYGDGLEADGSLLNIVF